MDLLYEEELLFVAYIMSIKIVLPGLTDKSMVASRSMSRMRMQGLVPLNCE